jgi:hypothetical protein
LSISRHRVFVFATILIGVSASVGLSQENFAGKGILAIGNNVLLFTTVRVCSAEPQLPSAQMLVSTDGGRSWHKRGPRLEGSEFEFVYQRRGQVWIAGLHTAEGPGIDPFVLVPSRRQQRFSWRKYIIHEGPSDLEGIAFGKKAELSALVSHIDMRNEDWKGVLYLHRSSNGGTSWRLVGRAVGARRQRGTPFERIAKENRAWRIVDQDDGGFVVQHRGAHESWLTASRFPLKPCH